MSIGLYIVLAPLYLKSVRKLQEKRFVFVKILAIIIPENVAKVSKIKCFQFAQQTLIMEYNEELRAWKNQTEQKKENPLEQPKKASVLEKLHRYQQEGRQQPKRSVKKKSMDRER